jgi:hypothetical protein
MAGLRCADPVWEPLATLTEREWKEAIEFCDRAQLTLLLGHVARGHLPDAVRARIDGNCAANAVRDARMRAALREIAGRLKARGIDYLLLKGYSHGLQYGPLQSRRPQYDIDLFVPPANLMATRDALLALDYEPLPGMAGFPTDHLPAMVRKTGWEWCGDFFDSEIPPSVDLHFRWWDAQTERFEAPGVEEFWQRRTLVEIDGTSLPALEEIDRLGYAALHLLRHLLRGSLRVYHVYEIAYFLNLTANDRRFWQRWGAQHPIELRRLQVIAFLLAHRWFACRVPESVQAEAQELPAEIGLWLDRYAAAPVEALFHPNKAELWLHVSLLPRISDRAAALRRRLLPLRPPGHVDSVYVPKAEMTTLHRLRRNARYTAHIAGRVLHHARAMVPTLAQGVSWALGGPAFVAFLLGANLYNLGAFIFFLLFNLLLLDLGFDERFIRAVAGAMTAGTIAGTLPAAALSRRVGLHRLLMLACAGSAALLAARALLVAPGAIVSAAFAGGVFSAFWFVSLPPVVARLSEEGRRPFAFSLWIASGIATGVAGGLLGSRLPSWIAAAGIASDASAAKRIAIVAGCGSMVAALWPLSRLRLPPAEVPAQRVYPRTRFVARFLLVFGVWQLAIGAFNPFFNVYFSRQLKMPLEQIGSVFAGSQFLQAIAVLVVPLALKRFGLASGVAVFQAATATCLVMIAAAGSPWSAALLYASYMSFQAMAEPGLFTMLLNRVGISEQGGASALLFLVMFSCHAIAAPLAGSALALLGYERLLVAAATLAFLAALLSRLTLSFRTSAVGTARAGAAAD